LSAGKTGQSPSVGPLAGVDVLLGVGVDCGVGVDPDPQAEAATTTIAARGHRSVVFMRTAVETPHP
jgi:hypothetical protein